MTTPRVAGDSAATSATGKDVEQSHGKISGAANWYAYKFSEY